MKLNCEYTEKL
jgi:hypothetical protein